MPRSIIRTITTAIAIAALAAPTALARPADTPPAVVKATVATQEQDTRSGAIDGYSQRPMNDRPSASGTNGETARPGPPTWPTDPEPINTASAGNASHGENGVGWTTIGLGIAGALLAIGTIAGITSRTGRARITA